MVQMYFKLNIFYLLLLTPKKVGINSIKCYFNEVKFNEHI